MKSTVILAVFFLFFGKLNLVSPSMLCELKTIFSNAHACNYPFHKSRYDIMASFERIIADEIVTQYDFLKNSTPEQLINEATKIIASADVGMSTVLDEEECIVRYNRASALATLAIYGLLSEKSDSK